MFEETLERSMEQPVAMCPDRLAPRIDVWRKRLLRPHLLPVRFSGKVDSHGKSRIRARL
jgi:hypothetical protein